MNKKWFTLVEMLIVIVIIGILLTLSMRISWDRVQILKTKSVWEQVVYNYNNLYAKNLLTNYYSWNMYDNMVIRFSEWDAKLYYRYKMYSDEKTAQDNNPWLSEVVQWWSYKVDKLYFEGNDHPVNEAYAVFEPYKIWCVLSNTSQNNENNSSYKKLKIDLLVNTNSRYCFEISKDLCKLQVVNCE